jgi:hypothetical protein
MSRERMVQDVLTKLGAGQQTDETMILSSREALMTVDQVTRENPDKIRRRS